MAQPFPPEFQSAPRARAGGDRGPASGTTAKLYAMLFANFAIHGTAGLFQISKNDPNPDSNRLPTQSRNPRSLPGTWGSRKPVHKTSGSVKSTGLIRAMMLRALHRRFIQKIEPQRVFLASISLSKRSAQLHPFLLPDLALEDRFLHARPVVLARARHTPQPAPARLAPPSRRHT